ncbi:hypothetical protein SELMODRAFT_415299 [Selaginella moellendorffii]|uniref:nucleoside-diphosphate kinase n=1 Tax=Selaginella moellendorffii TaxID=88036 RepID=D8RVN6_SELML|nr:hypothetical protein SELMODRAFT_415299 [Selaginella moellendorffii]
MPGRDNLAFKRPLTPKAAMIAVCGILWNRFLALDRSPSHGASCSTSRGFSPLAASLVKHLDSRHGKVLESWLQAEPGTIRGDLAVAVGRNVIHGSDSVANGEWEIGLSFGESELCKWQPELTPWLLE